MKFGVLCVCEREKVGIVTVKKDTQRMNEGMMNDRHRYRYVP